MPDYFRNKYRIDSHRLKGWDYRTPGWYFVTICTYEGIEYFGDIRNKIMGLSELGCTVWKYWYEIPTHQPHVQLGEFIVMPNHVHLTMQLTKGSIDKNRPVETLHQAGTNDSKEVSEVETCHGTSLQGNGPASRIKFMAEISPKSGSLSIIINHFKGAIRTWCKNNGHGTFAWQPGFHDHIVRNNTSLERINEYIRTNPEYWEEDRYHPGNLNK
ncbi:MAG: transposase [Candidatus Marinimicrobia bacterium]|nr:transposase [Candidatus Neomarinimicrobiota bacterium]MCF7828055.1 transposase [Candidatus Neomarinimicrobiota bacterium]MCF7879190.1 transposase [Candidatus Neomarinimicrobiota bacterium]